MTEKPFDDLIPTRNRAVGRRHRREVLLQIGLPLAFAAAVMLTVGGLLIGSAVTGAPTGHWRDLALVWVILPGLVAALIPLAVLAGLAYGVTRLIAVLPVWIYKLQQLFERAADAAGTISRAVTRPLIRLNALYAGLRRLFSRAGSTH